MKLIIILLLFSLSATAQKNYTVKGNVIFFHYKIDLPEKILKPSFKNSFVPQWFDKAYQWRKITLDNKTIKYKYAIIDEGRFYVNFPIIKGYKTRLYE